MILAILQGCAIAIVAPGHARRVQRLGAAMEALVARLSADRDAWRERAEAREADRHAVLVELGREVLAHGETRAKAERLLTEREAAVMARWRVEDLLHRAEQERDGFRLRCDIIIGKLREVEDRRHDAVEASERHIREAAAARGHAERWKALARRLRGEAETCQNLEAMAIAGQDEAEADRDRYALRLAAAHRDVETARAEAAQVRVLLAGASANWDRSRGEALALSRHAHSLMAGKEAARIAFESVAATLRQELAATRAEAERLSVELRALDGDGKLRAPLREPERCQHCFGTGVEVMPSGSVAFARPCPCGASPWRAL